MEKTRVETLGELRGLEGWKYADIVYKESNWEGHNFTLEQRTYRVNPGEKFFNPEMIGSSLHGSCLDGVDLGVRLDVYNWSVEYINVVY